MLDLRGKIYHWVAYTMLVCYSNLLNNKDTWLVVSFEE